MSDDNLNDYDPDQSDVNENMLLLEQSIGLSKKRKHDNYDSDNDGEYNDEKEDGSKKMKANETDGDDGDNEENKTKNVAKKRNGDEEDGDENDDKEDEKSNLEKSFDISSSEEDDDEDEEAEANDDDEEDNFDMFEALEKGLSGKKDEAKEVDLQKESKKDEASNADGLNKVELEEKQLLGEENGSMPTTSAAASSNRQQLSSLLAKEILSTSQSLEKKKKQAAESSSRELAKKKKLEQIEEENKKMQVLMANFSEEQLNRYEIFRRSAFPKSSVKKIIQTVCSKTVSASVVIAMSGIAKVFVGEIIEKALDVKADWNDTGPLQPKHLLESFRIYKQNNKVLCSHKAKKQSLF